MTPQQLLRLILVGLGISVVPLDTAVNIGFPDITRSFGLPLQMIQWVVICYVLTYASLMLGFGRVGDIFGHARVFRVGLAWSVAAFLLCAAAPSYGWLLFCRFLQGIGAGLVISVAPALVTGLYAESRRSRGVAAFTMIFALASASGPLIGGALVSRWGWPAVFWFRAPIALISLVFFKEPGRAAGSVARQPLDLAGALLLALTISSLLVCINEVPRLSREDWRAIPLFALAVAGFYAFVRREARFPAPIIKLELFRSGSFVAINAASVLIYFTSFSVLLFVPYYLVRTAGFSLPTAGAMLAVSFAGTIAASPLAGQLIDHVSAARIGCVGALLGGVGLIGLGGVDAGALTGAPSLLALLILAALVLQGFGVGLFQVAYMDVVLGRLPQHDRGVAGSIAMATRTVGIVSGATLLTLFFHQIEAAATIAAEPSPAAFLVAFRATLTAAGIVSILAGLATLALAKGQKA